MAGRQWSTKAGRALDPRRREATKTPGKFMRIESLGAAFRRCVSTIRGESVQDAEVMRDGARGMDTRIRCASGSVHHPQPGSGPRLGRARSLNAQSQPQTSESIRPASHHYSVGLEDARNTPLRPFKAVARVQIPLGPPSKTAGPVGLQTPWRFAVRNLGGSCLNPDELCARSRFRRSLLSERPMFIATSQQSAG